MEEKKIDWRKSLIRAEFDNTGLDILTAGRQDESYQKRVQGLNWENLFNNGIGNFLNDLRNEWINEYDYVFVDSRTGITDIGDICTVILPDLVVLLFVSNYQNVEGIEMLYTRATAAHKKLPVNRSKLIIVPIPSRDETYNEYDKSEEWKDIYAARFGKYFSNWLPHNVSAREAYNKLFIPYVAKWSFGESLPVIENKYEIQKPTSISAAYNRIAQLLLDDLDWFKAFSKTDPLEYQKTKSELSQANIEIEKKNTKLKRNYWTTILSFIITIAAALLSFLLYKNNERTNQALEQAKTDSIQAAAALDSISAAAKQVMDSVEYFHKNEEQNWRGEKK